MSSFTKEGDTRVKTRTVDAVASQKREFYTAQQQALGPGNRQRSESISETTGTVQQTRTETFGERNPPFTNVDGTFVKTLNSNDTGRQHKHPGSNWHEPTAGLVQGKTSTPAQRALLSLNSIGGTVVTSVRAVKK